MSAQSAAPVAISQTSIGTAFKLGFWAGLGFLAAWAVCWLAVMLLLMIFGISLWGIGRHASSAAAPPIQAPQMTMQPASQPAKPEPRFHPHIPGAPPPYGD